MKLNRKWLLLVALVLSLAMATTGTLAYLTDRDSEANVFTMGNVEIDLDENYEPDDELVPGETYPKQAWVKNTGKNDAYVWATIAVPAELEEALIIEKGTDSRWDWNYVTVKQETINGVLCNVYTVKYTEVLPSGEKTPNIIESLGMNSAVDVAPDGSMHLIVNGEEKEIDLSWNVLEDGLESVVYVSAYAIQTEGFDSFDAAYAAYNTQWGDNGTEYEDPNAAVTDTWDGTADTVLFANYEADTEFVIMTAEQLAGFSKMVDDGYTFENKTVKLGQNIDLTATDADGEAICFDPIGSYKNRTGFMGTFDGQNYTISNMTQNTWALNNGYYYSDMGLGLFAYVVDASIKNLTMDGANIYGESALSGAVAAAAYGDCTFENILVKNSVMADYQYYAGGIVAWASGNHQYINCDVDETTTVAAEWGDFDNSNGGIIGGCGGSATIYLEDCDVSCRIDAYNDVTSTYQWYAYRRSGMLIGNTQKTTKNDEGTTVAIAPQLTCKNVTVTYGEWANYTYCEFAGQNWPYVRVQAGVSNSAYSNPRYGHPTDANGNEVVDDNHVHNEGEDHFIALTFDQLYGGSQGVYGTSTHDGVTVIYNNK